MFLLINKSPVTYVIYINYTTLTSDARSVLATKNTKSDRLYSYVIFNDFKAVKMVQ